jgi:hypothetical protein
MRDIQVSGAPTACQAPRGNSFGGPFSCLPLDIGAMPCKSRGEAASFVAKRPRVRFSRMNHKSPRAAAE